MDQLPKNFEGITVADWLTFSPLLTRDFVSSEGKADALYTHLRSLANKALRGTQFVNSASDVGRVISGGSVWKKLREPLHKPEQQIAVKAMQNADVVLRYLSRHFMKEGAGCLAEATALHYSAGATPANDTQDDIGYLLEKGGEHCQGASSLSLLMYYAYDDEGVCRRNHEYDGETRDSEISMVADAIRGAKEGKFPRNPLAPKPPKRKLTFEPLRNMARKIGLGFLVPKRPAKGTAPPVSLPAAAND